MKFKDLLETLDGKENIELHVDSLQLHFTAQNTKEEYKEREIEKIRIDSQIYLGIKIYLKN